MVRKLKLEELGRVDVDTFKQQEKLPIVVVLDNIRSGLNVGSIFRTADAFSIDKIYLCGITAKPPHREILKTAIGATDSVNWGYEESIESCVEGLIEQGYVLIGVEQTSSSIALQEYAVDRERKYAIIFGNEVEGLNQELLPIVKEYIEIPQYGTKHSLNVAVCAGIVLWFFQKLLR
jgi:tRNA G18 (ribose-2'-O)-methylase SpoU